MATSFKITGDTLPPSVLAITWWRARPPQWSMPEPCPKLNRIVIHLRLCHEKGTMSRAYADMSTVRIRLTDIPIALSPITDGQSSR